jgi:hypothetical protein
MIAEGRNDSPDQGCRLNAVLFPSGLSFASCHEDPYRPGGGPGSTRLQTDSEWNPQISVAPGSRSARAVAADILLSLDFVGYRGGLARLRMLPPARAASSILQNSDTPSATRPGAPRSANEQVSAAYCAAFGVFSVTPHCTSSTRVLYQPSIGGGQPPAHRCLDRRDI